ncbi:hypothetical protein DVG78_09870 [Runella aurantiaca]|uniref:Uncharacterized protein n=1 Tax=Runella aurantiaca TaxID=2282308 RepID=A0A369I8N9_9BACT|nr:hypothetical protein DVG78_09870 [Runella aurantiaca]
MAKKFITVGRFGCFKEVKCIEFKLKTGLRIDRIKFLAILSILTFYEKINGIMFKARSGIDITKKSYFFNSV